MGMSTLVAAVEPIAAEGAKTISPAKPSKRARRSRPWADWSILAFALVGAGLVDRLRRLRRRLRRRLGSSRPMHDAWYQKPAPNDSSSDQDEPRP